METHPCKAADRNQFKAGEISRLQKKLHRPLGDKRPKARDFSAHAPIPTTIEEDLTAPNPKTIKASRSTSLREWLIANIFSLTAHKAVP